MANEEHVEILRRGVKAWNEWRGKNPDAAPDLSGTDFTAGALKDANLERANFVNTDLEGAHLGNAVLAHANLSRAILTGADLRGAMLNVCSLYSTNLERANLSGAHLNGASFWNCNLKDANLFYATITQTSFDNCDLSETENLAEVIHGGPSSIGIDTLYLSQGKIPEEFLRGAGVPDDFIVFAASLVGSAIHYYSCFISYSSEDQQVADRLHSDLQRAKVRCWLATEDLKIGDKFRARIDEAVRLHDKVVIVLSENSISSGWVEDEVEAALEREKREKKTILFPVRLDDAVMDTDEAWAASIRRTRHIGDFTKWKDHDSYKKAFDRVLRDLHDFDNVKGTHQTGL